MQQHTKEPWRYDPADVKTFVDPKHGEEIYLHEIMADSAYALGYTWSLENLKRIVACVNACKDISDPETEIAKLRQEKADLLKALERIDALLNNSEIYNHAWTNAPEKPEIAPRDIAKAAIAKAKP